MKKVQDSSLVGPMGVGDGGGGELISVVHLVHISCIYYLTTRLTEVMVIYTRYTEPYYTLS